MKGSNDKMDIYKYWDAVIKQDNEQIAGFFHKNAYIRWHNTNEQFSVNEFVRANCEYPGQWEGSVERVESFDNLTITVTRVWTKDEKISFHVVSFIKIQDDKIISIDEYWGDDGESPQWRKDLNLGSKIN